METDRGNLPAAASDAPAIFASPAERVTDLNIALKARG